MKRLSFLIAWRQVLHEIGYDGSGRNEPTLPRSWRDYSVILGSKYCNEKIVVLDCMKAGAAWDRSWWYWKERTYISTITAWYWGWYLKERATHYRKLCTYRELEARWCEARWGEAHWAWGRLITRQVNQTLCLLYDSHTGMTRMAFQIVGRDVLHENLWCERHIGGIPYIGVIIA